MFITYMNFKNFRFYNMTYKIIITCTCWAFLHVAPFEFTCAICIRIFSLLIASFFLSSFWIPNSTGNTQSMHIRLWNMWLYHDNRYLCSRRRSLFRRCLYLSFFLNVDLRYNKSNVNIYIFHRTLSLTSSPSSRVDVNFTFTPNKHKRRTWCDNNRKFSWNLIMRSFLKALCNLNILSI